jgi:hypothetical protein
MLWDGLKLNIFLLILVSNFISWCNIILNFITTIIYVFGSIEEIALCCNAWVPYWVGCKLDDQVSKLLTLDIGFG